MKSKPKQRRASKTPEWSDNAVYSPSLNCCVHGLEVWKAIQTARLYVAPGERPTMTALAGILNMMVPGDVTFVEVISAGKRTDIMVSHERWWRAGEPLDEALDDLGEGAFIRLPAITDRPRYSGALLRRTDRPGITNAEAAA